MPEWWTYTLSDFLLFSPRTYWRLVERYNLAIWPVQIIGAAIGAGIVWSLIGKRALHGRAGAALLAVCWLWTAWAFHLQYYAQINWAAPWFAAAFALQAVILIATGVFPGRLTRPARASPIGPSLVALIVLGYPLLAPLAGRAWTTAESFGATPDPTAITTMAATALVSGRVRWLLLPIPLAWCAVSAAMLWAMRAPETFVVVSATLLALWSAVRGRDRGCETTEG